MILPLRSAAVLMLFAAGAAVLKILPLARLTIARFGSFSASVRRALVPAKAKNALPELTACAAAAEPVMNSTDTLTRQGADRDPLP